MSPENANIFIAEDNRPFMMALSRHLESDGHKVVRMESTLFGAMTAVAELGTLSVNVALLDGNLSHGDYSGSDGERIAEAIKSTYGKDIAVIGIATSRPISGADINPGKMNKEAIRQAVKEV